MLPPPESGSDTLCRKTGKQDFVQGYEFIQKLVSHRDTRTYYPVGFFFLILFYSLCLFLFVCFLSRFFSLFELNVTVRCHSKPGLFIVESSSILTFKVSSTELKVQLFWSGNGKGLF